MTDLEETFGEDFAQHVQKKTAERREERNRVTEEQLAEICSLAINEQKFDDGDPMFQYTTENGITHDAILMQVPDPDNSEVWDYMEEPWEGAVSLPLEYLGEWYSSTFFNKEDLKKINEQDGASQGSWLIAVGSMEDREADDGKTYTNVDVRGVATLNEAQKYASADLADEFGTDESEPEESDDDSAADPGDFATDDDSEGGDEAESDSEDVDDSDEEEDNSDSSSSGGLNDLLDDDDDEEEDDEEEKTVDYDEVAHTVEELAEKQDDDEEPQIMNLTPEDDKFGRLSEIVAKQCDYDDVDAVAEVVGDVIVGQPEDDEEEEEDDDEDDTGKLF